MKKQYKYLIISLIIIIPLIILFMFFISFSKGEIKENNKQEEGIKEIIIDDPFFEF